MNATPTVTAPSACRHCGTGLRQCLDNIAHRDLACCAACTFHDGAHRNTLLRESNKPA